MPFSAYIDRSCRAGAIYGGPLSISDFPRKRRGIRGAVSKTDEVGSLGQRSGFVGATNLVGLWTNPVGPQTKSLRCSDGPGWSHGRSHFVARTNRVRCRDGAGSSADERRSRERGRGAGRTLRLMRLACFICVLCIPPLFTFSTYGCSSGDGAEPGDDAGVPVECGTATCAVPDYCFHPNDCPGFDAAGLDVRCGALAPYCGDLGDAHGICLGGGVFYRSEIDLARRQVSCVNP